MVMRTSLLLLAALTLTGFAIDSDALEPGDRVDNFKLLDHTGKMHELYYLSDHKAVVMLVHGEDAHATQAALQLQQWQQTLGEPAEFLLLSPLGDRQSIRQAVARQTIELPVLVDPTQLISESLGVDTTAEVFIIDPQNWQLVYRGAVDNANAQQALQALVADKTPTLASSDVAGEPVKLPGLMANNDHANISYSEDIAPILIDKCLTCHRDGGIGPFAMSEYNMIRGFAPMIREVVRTQRMPPWHADPHVGEFENDRSLSTAQKQTLVHWIEAGAPRGEGPDPLAEYQHNWPQWAMGEPDVIVDIPPTEVPATGVVDYKYIKVKNPTNRDLWVKAVQVLPGAREVLHHTVISITGTDSGGFAGAGGGSLPGYIPGDNGFEFPAGTGVHIAKGATIQFQMHYTTYGKARTDASKLGLYLHAEKPEHVLKTQYLANPFINIPPNTHEHWEQATNHFKTDVILYSILPHAHFRGKAATFIAQYPDGREEVLLDVPNYDFNWQTTYFLEQPKVLPAGTKIIQRMAWDNSSQNPANPDPSITVTWGEQSWEEMLFGALRYREIKEGEAPQLTAN